MTKKVSKYEHEKGLDLLVYTSFVKGIGYSVQVETGYAVTAPQPLIDVKLVFHKTLVVSIAFAESDHDMVCSFECRYLKKYELFRVSFTPTSFYFKRVILVG